MSEQTTFDGRMRLLICLAAWLAFSVPVSALEFDSPATLIRVVDGDTYVMKIHLAPGVYMSKPVRLDVFDTPEIRGRCEREKVLAKEATEFAKAWFARVNSVRITYEKLDSFRRPIAMVISEERRSLGLDLADAGLAVPFKKGRTEGWCPD